MHIARQKPRPLIRAILIDVSGTLHVGNKPLPRAAEAIRRLRSFGIPFRLCSNTSKESTHSLVSRLRSQGFDVSNDEQRKDVWTSIGAVRQVLREQRLHRPYLLLSESACDELADLRNTDGAVTSYDSVVVALAPSALSYPNLNTAFRVLVGGGQSDSELRHMTDAQGCNSPPSRAAFPLIATHMARYLQSDTDDRLSLGPGPFVAALEYAAGIKAYVVGKPTKAFFETVMNDFRAEETSGKQGVIAIVGDDIENDLGDGALQLGLWRVLVRTGKYRPGDETKEGVSPPDEIAASFSAFTFLRIVSFHAYHTTHLHWDAVQCFSVFCQPWTSYHSILNIPFLRKRIIVDKPSDDGVTCHAHPQTTTLSSLLPLPANPDTENCHIIYIYIYSAHIYSSIVCVKHNHPRGRSRAHASSYKIVPFFRSFFIIISLCGVAACVGTYVP
ncbi:hypothetical protein AMATHDRAFT_200130 [Amanita thiersii Skay4041]|uniref:Uncharacterized protein n=1 Tax=Amanita thiersii Skay4041 TaxID=703135 RepID=A0A2A9NDX8_9AGAR|nr:hypothetical protein AMATHDRAFT_200130 [Amanita thiersii Skay4041]